MKSRDELLAWVTYRATDKEDVARASKFIAAYVAECVREDRTREGKSLFDTVFGPWS